MPAAFEGLQPPVLKSMGDLVTGGDTNKLWLQNKRQCHKLQDKQPPAPWWTKHTRESILPPSCEHHFKSESDFTHLFQLQLCPFQAELMDGLPAHLHDSYARDIHLADDTFHSG